MTQSMIDDDTQLQQSGQLRKATIADAVGIQKLINSNDDKLLVRPDEELHELIKEDAFWVIEENSHIVGCACLEIYSPKIAELRSLAVQADRRGLGYGKLLVETIVQDAQRRHIGQILVVTSSREFFEGLNFGACLNEKYALFWNGTGRGE